MEAQQIPNNQTQQGDFEATTCTLALKFLQKATPLVCKLMYISRAVII